MSGPQCGQERGCLGGGGGQSRIDLEGARKRAEESTTISETESEEESDGEPNGVTGGEEESQGASGSSGAVWSREEDG